MEAEVEAEPNKIKIKRSKRVNTAKKGSCCSRCRSRKVKCSAERPSCSSCKRSGEYKHRDMSTVICCYDKEGLCSEDKRLDQSQRTVVPRTKKKGPKGSVKKSNSIPTKSTSFSTSPSSPPNFDSFSSSNKLTTSTPPHSLAPRYTFPKFAPLSPTVLANSKEPNQALMYLANTFSTHLSPEAIGGEAHHVYHRRNESSSSSSEGETVGSRVRAISSDSSTSTSSTVNYHERPQTSSNTYYHAPTSSSPTLYSPSPLRPNSYQSYVNPETLQNWMEPNFQFERKDGDERTDYALSLNESPTNSSTEFFYQVQGIPERDEREGGMNEAIWIRRNSNPFMLMKAAAYLDSC